MLLAACGNDSTTAPPQAAAWCMFHRDQQRDRHVGDGRQQL
jgi:hypothetical protein